MQKFIWVIFFAIVSVLSVIASQAQPASDIPQLNTEVEKKIHKKECFHEDKHCAELYIVLIKSNNEAITKTIKSLRQKTLVDFDSFKNNKNIDEASDLWFKEAKHAIEEEGMPGYFYSYEEKYLSQRDALAKFEIHGSIYTGGVHGDAFSSYYMLDTRTGKQLTLDDLVIPGKMKALEHKMREIYAEQDFARPECKTKEKHGTESTCSFELSDSVLFSDNDVTFSYPAYSLAGYAAGLPELKLDYQDARKYFKAEWLPDYVGRLADFQ